MLRRLEKKVAEMAYADDVAQAVADELQRRRDREGRNISVLWMKAGIVAIVVSIVVSVASLTWTVAG